MKANRYLIAISLVSMLHCSAIAQPLLGGSSQRAKYEQRKARLQRHQSDNAKLINYHEAAVQPALSVVPADWLPFLPLDDKTTESEQTVSGIIPLSDNRKLGALKDKPFCETILSELRKQLNTAGPVIASLSIHGYGAPTGNYHRNEQRSGLRAQALKEYLIEHQAAGTISITWTAEDWQRIMQLTQADNSLILRSAALDIMQNIDITAGRENQLQALASGQTYAQLQKQVFPQVQRLEYTATIHHPVVNSSEPTRLQTLYKTAEGLKRGSDEYNDLIDLAARLNPDNAVAAINAASVALIKGDLEWAEHYLTPWQTDTRAYQALGVLHLLKGDKARAEVYLNMAKAQGVKEATEVLNNISNY